VFVSVSHFHHGLKIVGKQTERQKTERREVGVFTLKKFSAEQKQIEIISISYFLHFVFIIVTNFVQKQVLFIE
jgi:hypothetical protein